MEMLTTDLIQEWPHEGEGQMACAMMQPLYRMAEGLQQLWY